MQEHLAHRIVRIRGPETPHVAAHLPGELGVDPLPRPIRTGLRGGKNAVELELVHGVLSVSRGVMLEQARYALGAASPAIRLDLKEA